MLFIDLMIFIEHQSQIQFSKLTSFRITWAHDHAHVCTHVSTHVYTRVFTHVYGTHYTHVYPHVCTYVHAHESWRCVRRIYLWCMYLWCIYLWCIYVWCIYLWCIYLWCIYLWCIYLWCVHLGAWCRPTDCGSSRCSDGPGTHRQASGSISALYRLYIGTPSVMPR